MISWIIVGMYLGPVIYVYVPVTLLIFKSRNQYLEMLLGFFLMLVLSDSRSDNLRFAEFTKEIYIITLGIFLFIDIKNFTPFSKFFVRFIPFFLIAFLCVINGPVDNFYNAIEKTISYILLLIVVPNYVQRAHMDKGIEFYRAVVLLSTAILLMGFVFRFISPGLVSREGRFQGILGNPNGLGIFSLLAFLFFRTGLEFYPALVPKKGKIIIYSIIILCVILSGSRGSLFGLLIFLVFSYFYKTSPFLGSFVALALIASFSYISENLISVINALGLQNYLRSETLEAGSGRFVAWSFSWQHINESFWFGRGFEYTEYLFNIHENVIFLQAMGHQGNAHNSYITLWLDTGLVGLTAYSLAFISCFIKAAGRTRLALPFMFAAIFSSFFESWLTASLNPFTIQVIIILSIFTSDVIFPAKTKVAVSL